MEPSERVRMCQSLLQEVAAPWVQELGLQVQSADERELLLVVPVRPALVHAGGVLCGQAMMPVPGTAESIQVRATVLRRGKTLAFGEIALHGPDGSLAAHATTTYALL